MNECIGIIGTLFGHSFRPRYSIEGQEHSVSSFDFPFWRSTTYTIKEGVSEISHEPSPTYKKTYVGDVCTRCGATAGRDQCEQKSKDERSMT